MLKNHECYRSHDTWTIFCRGLLFLGDRASQTKKKGGGASPPVAVSTGWDGIECDEGEFRDEEEPDEGVDLYAMRNLDIDDVETSDS